MAQQKALFLSGVKGDFTIQNKEIPKPSPEQLLVKIDAAGLNPLDWKNRNSGHFVPRFPVVLGIEAAGTVAEIGLSVSGFSKGDRVFLQATFTAENDQAAFQQYLVVAAENVGKVPSNISTDEAASIPVGTGTVITGFYGDRKGGSAKRLTAPWEEGGVNLYKGEPVVILGGSSSVGQYAIQFAKLSGFSPIITTASLHNTELLKSLGATHVVDRHSDVKAEIKKVTDLPIEFVLDAISEGGTQELALDILASGGTVAYTLRLTVDKDKYPDKRTFNIISLVKLNKEVSDGYSKHLPKLFEEGLLKPNRVEVLKGGLAAVEAGLKRLEENKVSGYKLVIHPQEKP